MSFTKCFLLRILGAEYFTKLQFKKNYIYICPFTFHGQRSKIGQDHKFTLTCYPTLESVQYMNFNIFDDSAPMPQRYGFATPNSHLSNRRSWNKRGGSAKFPELRNKEVGLNMNGGIFWRKK